MNASDLSYPSMEDDKEGHKALCSLAWRVAYACVTSLYDKRELEYLDGTFCIALRSGEFFSSYRILVLGPRHRPFPTSLEIVLKKNLNRLLKITSGQPPSMIALKSMLRFSLKKFGER